ncbi:MAG: glycosyltransferase [Methylococcaceae bacterium]|nr:glycosyltransferase [Methylococcaceae bacterium]MDZ4156130.1 glycosyltransferase [Methylococcales bacterium]MDP2393709.1 glycosyltransferase [Methylococcaceae bacterium]MDP3019735.1 glycosyltransferase [Methylococcaceae bacterium]MDP3390203.1 glycosyltransferase [Methylococcaceae bacterium]
MNKITFITTVLNDEKGINSLFDGLLEQSTRPDEIIVVDGGSKDNTLAKLESYLDKFTLFKIIQAPNTNISQGRNLAILNASHPIIVVTDAGCRPDKNWIFEISKPLLDDSEIYAVSGKVISETSSVLEHYSGLLSIPDHTTKEQEELFYGRNSAFRKTLWEQVGGYPEWLYTAEDSLFALAAKKRGFSISHNPKAIIFWRPRNSLRKIAKMFYLYGKGNGRIAWGGDIKGTLYWLRNHGVLFLSFLLGFIYPFAWIATALLTLYLYKLIALPSLIKIRAIDKDWRREAYIPLITFIRNLSSNLGYLSGFIEYKNNPIFKENLDKYINNLK